MFEKLNTSQLQDAVRSYEDAVKVVTEYLQLIGFAFGSIWNERNKDYHLYNPHDVKCLMESSDSFEHRPEYSNIEIARVIAKAFTSTVPLHMGNLSESESWCISFAMGTLGSIAADFEGAKEALAKALQSGKPSPEM